MSFLTRDAILGADDRPPLKFPMPEWGGDVLIATVDARTLAAYEEATEGPYELLRALVVSIFVVDESGRPLFTAADVPALNLKSGVAISRLFRACIRHNRLRKVDRDDAEKNSAPASGDNSSTGSLATCTAPSPSFSAGSAPRS